MKKIAIAVAALLSVWAIYHYVLGDPLTLANLKAQQAGFDALYAKWPLLVLGGFFLIYIAVTAFSLPGAAIMTLAAGALFGVLTGTILVSFASSIGATLAFLGARYLFRDLVIRRFGTQLAPLNAGIEKDGAFYLLTLRLVPVFPFFLINLLMGLTRIPTRTYYWVSQIGMLLGTIVYVNAGRQLATIEKLSDIVSPVLLASFAALGAMPWVARWLVRRLRPNTTA